VVFRASIVFWPASSGKLPLLRLPCLSIEI
jgi:hypothetical protein